MIKLNNSFFKVTKNLNNNINFIESEDTNKIHSNKMNLLIDIKDIREIKKSERILGVKYLPRGTLELWIDTNSPYYKKFFNENFNFIFYCASNWRTALAILAANNVGLLNSSHLKDGYNRCLKLNGLIEKAR